MDGDDYVLSQTLFSSSFLSMDDYVPMDHTHDYLVSEIVRACTVYRHLMAGSADADAPTSKTAKSNSHGSVPEPNPVYNTIFYLRFRKGIYIMRFVITISPSRWDQDAIHTK